MAVRAFVLAVCLTLLGAGTATAEPYTKQFQGEGSSSFGFAWEYARAQAASRARADGFAEPWTQCVEIYAYGDNHDARVIWECTREV